MRDSTIKRSAETGSPLRKYLSSYDGWLVTQGYAASTRAMHMSQLARLDRWMDSHRISAMALNHDRLDDFLVTEPRNGARVNYAPTRRFLGHLRQLGIVGEAPLQPSTCPVAQVLVRYEAYLRITRALSEKTLVNYVPSVRALLMETLEDDELNLTELAAKDVCAFVVRQAGSMAPKTVQVLASALRSFFRFLLQEGEIDVDLAASVPTIPSRRLATIPKYIDADAVQRMIDACDSSSTGRRDSVILLLLARLGLRAGEVAALELGDIAWRAGEIHVPGKTTRSDHFPLTEEIGAALALYIRDDRPACDTRRIFIRAQAPRGPLSVSAVGTIVRKALASAGIEAPTRGAYLLRHSLATSLLGAGVTLADVGDVLRHRSMETTQLYAKVDFQGLRSVVRPWPGANIAGLEANALDPIDYPDVTLNALRSLVHPWPSSGGAR